MRRGEIMEDLLEKRVDELELMVRKKDKKEEMQEKQLEELRVQNNVLIGKMEGEYCQLKINLEVKQREGERLLLANESLSNVNPFL
jgi:hypothetical protein